MLYASCGCPVCGPTFPLAFVKSISTGLVFVFCHSCQCCWNPPPVSGRLDTVDAVSAFAPLGMAEATAEEINLASLGSYIGPEIVFVSDPWSRLFRPFLLQR